jgi:protein SCO1/2
MGLGLLVGGLSALALVPQARDWLPAPQVTGKVLIGGPFSLIDQTGKRVTEQDFRGRKMLVFFGFTNCPDVCPGGLQVISAALDRLGSKADGVVPLFITVDPERDTPDVMAGYAKSFHRRLVALTGSVDEVKAAASAYRVYYKKVEGKDWPNGYTVDHSSIIYLMNESGDYIGHFPYPIAADKLAADLAKAL